MTRLLIMHIHSNPFMYTNDCIGLVHTYWDGGSRHSTIVTGFAKRGSYTRIQFCDFKDM